MSPKSILEMLAMRERECIFIPLKITKRKHYKNAVDGVVLAAIQIAEDPIKRRTDGASAFNTRTARGRLLLLDPARGEEKLRESSGSTTEWWRSLWYSCRASPSTTKGEEVLEEGGAAPGKGCRCPLSPPVYKGGRGGGGALGFPRERRRPQGKP